MAFSAILELPRRFMSFINRLFHGWDTLSEDVGDESAEESDWSSEEEGTSKHPRTDSGHRKARRSQRAGKAHKDRKPKNNTNKESKSEEKTKGKSAEEASSPRAPLTSLAEILSSKEGLKSATLKSNAKENSSGSDDVDGKGTKEQNKSPAVSRKVDNSAVTSPTVIKIKPPPPKAPKPKAKRMSSVKSIDISGDVKKTEKTVSHSSIENIFDGMEITQPKLTSYKRTMGPQGRRLPQRYSNQSQRYSNQSRNSMTAVSA